MKDVLVKELIKLGLSEKEASVYIAAIQIGSSPVQKISQKAKVNRATTYVIIDSLTQMGLMSTYDEGAKTYYVAQKPDQLINFFTNKESELHEKIKRLEDVLPELNMLYRNHSDRPRVKYYEGLEGLKAVQSDFADSLEKEDVMYIFLPYDEFERSVLKKRLNRIRQKRVRKKIRVKVIYTSRFGRQKEYESDGKKRLQEHLFVDRKKYPFQGGMNIYGNKIFMIDYLGRLGGVVIENKILAHLLKCIFEMIWSRKKSERK
ncbi:MAG: helix-turn-helix domain-containing protein [Patescibacteria group bacterium]|nr:helix-turn-helix domain-containing protein [Patescibacteria group bacterium]